MSRARPSASCRTTTWTLVAAANGISRVRAGLVQCLCGPFLAPLEEDAVVPARSAGSLAAGFGLTVLSQVLSLSALPLAGEMLARGGEPAALPLAALVLGAALA